MKDQVHSVNNPADSSRLSSGELVQEAQRQSQALKMIGRWRTIGFVIAAVGSVLIYGGVTRADRSILMIAAGAIIAAAGLAVAILCDLGIRNGRRNVEKILRAAEETPSRKMNPHT